MKKKHVLLFCGGQSSEHEVSLRSAANVYKAIDPAKYDVSVIGIDHQGAWHKLSGQVLLEHQGMTQVETKPREISDLAVKLGDHKNLLQSQQVSHVLDKVDVVFPVLHGPNGEDGTIQGLLRLANLACVGSDVIGSAICMDKDVSKRLLRDAGIPVADFLTFRAGQPLMTFDEVVQHVGLPFFVKPCNLGSSVGISKVHHKDEFEPAVEKAFAHDQKIIIEKYIKGHEIECAVLGNENPKASVLGEIIPHHEFYSYEVKYLDENGASLVIPANLPEAVAAKVQQLAIAAFQVLECCDFARIDFFVTDAGEIYLNELNTLPGFTSISMYPMLWQATGLSYEALIENLIELARARFEKAKQLKR